MKSIFALAAVMTALILLSACGASRSSPFVTPGKFHLYSCAQLVPQAQHYLSREKELRGLRAKAKVAPGGGLVSEASYGLEYSQVQGTVEEVRREVIEKNCSPPPPGLMEYKAEP